jgi:hypothetical protein
MLANDPVLAIYIALKGFPIASPIVPTAKFLCMHPETGLDSQYQRQQESEKKIARRRSAMEAKVFSTRYPQEWPAK